jgi:DpnII restriction endonuclease
MKVLRQNLDEILQGLSPLIVEWQDDVARRVIAAIEVWPIKNSYSVEDVKKLLTLNFDDGLLVCRLFLGLSKDQFEAALKDTLQKGGIGIKRYHTDPDGYVDKLVELGLLEAMSAQVMRTPKWSDVLVERLRSGRGSAISGQKRGRSVEDFVEGVVGKVFGKKYVPRCTFQGPRGKNAKCDFAIPSKETPEIVIEAKGYGATGSKMSDIIGDVQAIIDAKRSDTAFLFFTDGLTWKQRKSDLRKIVDLQNTGDITRIYTYSLAKQFEKDLRQLKREHGL